MSLSTSTSVPQHGAHVLSELLSELIAGQRIDTKLWLRGEMDRLVDPMLDSIFQRLANKLVNAGWDCDGDSAQVMDSLDHSETDNHHQSFLIAQPSKSTYNLNFFPQQSTGYEPEFDPEILAQVKREIKEEENETEFKNVMDKSSKVNGLIEDCNEHGEDMTSHEQVNNVIDSDTHLEPEIKKEFDDYQTTNSGQIEEALEDTEIDDNQVEVPFRSVENVQMDTSTPPHHNGQSQVIVKQPERIAKRKQTEYKEQSNEINNREDTGKEDDDEQEGVTSRLVKRPRPSRPSSSSTKQNTQIITHTLQCPQCGLMFAPDKFNPHLKKDHSIFQFRCLVKKCAQSFSNNRLLCHHLAQSHQSTSSQWHCDKCDKQHFTSYHGLSVHSIQQHQIGHFQCSFPACTFTGDCKQNVYNHYACQHKQTFKCDHSGCLYETPKAANLKLHNRVHSGIKPYSCKWLQCGHEATSQSDVMKHIRRHLTRNPSSAPDGAKPKDFLEIRNDLL